MGRLKRPDDGESVVWSSDSGRIRESRETVERSRPKPATPRAAPEVPKDGIVRVGRTKAGRGGKTVTVVTGVPADDRSAVLSELKRRCGSGGAVKEEAIELQGDQRERVRAALEGRYRVILAGG